jgi:hypothetical protein
MKMTKDGQEFYIYIINYLCRYGIITDEEYEVIIERLKNVEITGKNAYNGDV